MALDNIRDTFRDDIISANNGKKFQIIGLRMEDVGGDNLEPIFTVKFEDGSVETYVDAECIFSGYDVNFDAWVEKNPLTP